MDVLFGLPLRWVFLMVLAAMALAAEPWFLLPAGIAAVSAEVANVRGSTLFLFVGLVGAAVILALALIETWTPLRIMLAAGIALTSVIGAVWSVTGQPERFPGVGREPPPWVRFGLGAVLVGVLIAALFMNLLG